MITIRKERQKNEMHPPRNRSSVASSMNAQTLQQAAPSPDRPGPFGRDISTAAFKQCLALLVILGMVTRSGYLVEHAHSPLFAVPQLDERYYVAVSKLLLTGADLHLLHGFRPLLYPLFLAAFEQISAAHGIDLAIITQHCLGIATGVLVAFLGARLFRHRLCGIVGGALYLLSPVPLCFEGEILTEASFTFLVALVLLLHLLAAHASGWKSAWLWMGGGALLALAAQDRVNILVLLAAHPLLAAAQWWRGRKISALAPLLAWVAALAMIISWAVFNMRQTDYFHLLPGTGGINFYLGNKPGADGFSFTEPRHIPYAEDYQDIVELWSRADYEAAMRAEHRQPSNDPMAVSHYWMRRFFEVVKANPARWLKLMAKKFWLGLWNAEVPNLKSFAFMQDQFAWLRLLPVRWAIVLMLAPAGIWAAAKWGDRAGLLIVTVYVAFYYALNLFFFMYDRYRYPLWPAMAVLAGGGALATLASIRQDRTGRTICLLTGMLLLALISVPNWLGIRLPNFARDYLFRSEGWYEQGNFREALSDVNLSLQLAPGEGPALVEKGNVLLALKQMNEARQTYEQALDKNPDDSIIWNNYGQSLEGLGQTNAALTAYRRAMDLVPPSQNAFLDMAFLQLRVGRVDDAATALDRLEKAYPQPNAMALALRAVIAKARGDAKGAAELEARARSIDAAATAAALKHAK